MELPIIFNDRYQLVKKIGEGGLAEVYQAQDMSLGRMVAVKVLRPQYTRDPNFLVNFHREAQNAARLSDSYIVAVYDFGQDKGRPYIVMEWVAGSDLRTMIDEQGPLAIDQAVTFAIQVCSAVGAAHRAGIVHGDLKPGNILITPGSQAKVTDFGLARALGESAMEEGEVVWGTPAYFAPEQASGDRVLPATDVYATGIILYEMLTGRVPFVGVDDQDVARKQLYEAHIPVDRLKPEIPEPLARIVDAAMAKNPNERFLTADHLREALMMYRRGGLSASGPQAPISAVVGSPLQRVGYAGSVPPPPPPPPPSSVAAHQRYVPASQAAMRSRKGGFDVVILLLGIIAIIAIAGLIPLFVAIYQAYIPEPSGIFPTPLPTLLSDQVRMPDLVGLEETAARAVLADMDVKLVVEAEEPHPTWPAFTVIKQSVPAGAGVDKGGEVAVVISQGPPLIEVPDVRGMDFDEAQRQLALLDLVIQKYEEWSVETPGHVLLQDPPPGSLVANRTLTTLVVSSGSRVPMDANLGGQIVLKAYEIPRVQFKPGETVNLTFFWQITAPVVDDYNFFVYLTTPQGGIVSQVDSPPQGLGPTSQWSVGNVVYNQYQLPIPVSTVPGEYQIRIGFYKPDSKVRLPIVEPGRGEQDNLGALILRSIQVVQ
ncbi:MAG: protein kinase [Anaerolineae bacterium]|nr:protein kinase [Anaerolineae bacterium]